MPMVIYTDNSNIGANGQPINTSPAGIYALTDLDQILDLIENGKLQCGTGQPYPVDWDDDDDDRAPWEDKGPRFVESPVDQFIK